MGRRLPSFSLRTLGVVAGVLVLATLAAGLVLYRPSVSPPGLHARNLFSHGVAKQTLFVDTPTPTLVDRDQTALGPPSVALTYALYLQTDLARAEVGAAVGQPLSAIAASGPYTLLLPRPNLVVQRTNPVPEAPKPSDRDYRLLLDVTEAQPALQIYAQAPTAREAAAMVAAAGELLRRYVRENERTHPVAEESRSVVRSLGGVESATIDAHAKQQLAMGVFLLVCLGSGLIAYRRSRRRRADAGVAPPRLAPVEPIRRALDDWPNTHRLLPWMIAGFLVMIFVIPFGAVEVPMPLPGDGVLDRPFIMVLSFVWLCGLLASRRSIRPRVRITRVHVAILVFFGIALFSAALNAGELAQIQLLGTGIKKLVVLVNYLLMFIIAASCIRPGEVPAFARLIAVLSGIAALGTIIESRFDYNVFFDLSNHLFPGMVSIPDDLHGLDEIGRATIYGPTSQPLELATMLALSTPFAVLGLLDSEERRNKWKYAILLALLLAASFSTGRKSSVLVPAVGLFVILAYRPGSLRNLLPVGTALVFVVNVLAPGMMSSLFFQLTHVGAVKSTQARSADYDAVWSDVTGHLLVGRGFKTFDPHVYRILDNEYLGLLIGVGVLGVMAYLAIYGMIVSAAHDTIRGSDPMRARYALAGAACAVSAAFASFLFDLLSFPHVPYLIFIIGAMVVALREPSPPADDDELPPDPLAGAQLEHWPELEPAGAPRRVPVA